MHFSLVSIDKDLSSSVPRLVPFRAAVAGPSVVRVSTRLSGDTLIRLGTYTS